MRAIVALCLVAVVFGERITFEQYKEEFGKVYTSAHEESKARKNFEHSMTVVETLTAADPNAEFGATKFSDMSAAEFRGMYLNKRGKTDMSKAIEGTTVGLALPTTFDWRSRNVITPVKNQGQCGSCWAFSTVENVESMWALGNHSLVELSPQQLVSCSHHGNEGCNGGNPPIAFDYIVKVGGLESSKDYPYTSGNGADGECKFEKDKVVATIHGFKWATKTGNEPAMQQALYEWGPLSICVDATTWQHYRSGIVTSNCGTQLDHCVQLVGWGVQSSSNYWIVRNSWAADWGINGYIYIKMGHDLCGIAKEATCAEV